MTFGTPRCSEASRAGARDSRSGDWWLVVGVGDRLVTRAPGGKLQSPTSDVVNRPPTTGHRLHHSIKVTRTGRYETLGPEDRTVDELWFVLHGYGQLAATFIRKFDVLADGTRLIVAPEALNRFYLVGVESAPAAERPVGATWMTREDRENEISDYVGYLDAVAADVRHRLPNGDRSPRIMILGFSQATATAVRWVASGSIAPSNLILWGGFVPPEIDTVERARAISVRPLELVLGSADGFVSPERLAEEERRLRDLHLPYRLTRYEGGHSIQRDVLRDLAGSLA